MLLAGTITFSAININKSYAMQNENCGIYSNQLMKSTASQRKNVGGNWKHIQVMCVLYQKEGSLVT